MGCRWLPLSYAASEGRYRDRDHTADVPRVAPRRLARSRAAPASVCWHRLIPSGGMSTIVREVRLDVEGMSCASCAARVEKALNGLDGVDATVNFATEQATLHCASEIPVEELVGAVE